MAKKAARKRNRSRTPNPTPRPFDPSTGSGSSRAASRDDKLTVGPSQGEGRHARGARSTSKGKSRKYVYFFGNGKADGNRNMKDLLGGKGSGLAEMTNAGLPVPPGFTISTGVCNIYYQEKGKVPPAIDREIGEQVRKLEQAAGATLGSTENPLLVSVRSGAKFSMPGMMDTILNLGLNDEAVEGLMASHVLQGEHPAFLWGQHYKGVPEVYLAAAVFAVTGPSVIALKSVTLACFALFVCLQYVLVERLFSRAIAWMATAFLVLCPPSLVLWSLSANAEVVMTLLAGTVMCLGIDIWRRTGSRAAFMTACAAAGFGLWVHQYIVYYWIALGLAILHSLPQRRKILEYVVTAREIPAWLRMLTALFAFVAVVYVALGAVAFLTGGFDAAALGVRIGVHHPQKLWNIAAGLLIIVVLARAASLSARQSGSTRSLAYAAALAFAVG